MKTRKNALTPDDCIRQLPEPRLEFTEVDPAEDLRRIELRRSVLAIAELNPVTESQLVREVAEKVRDGLPGTDE